MINNLNIWYSSNRLSARLNEQHCQQRLQSVYKEFFPNQVLTDYLFYFTDYIYYEIWQNKLEVTYAEDLLNFRQNEDFKTKTDDIYFFEKSLTKYFLINFNDIEKKASNLYFSNPKGLKLSYIESIDNIYQLFKLAKKNIEYNLLPVLSNYYLSVCYVDLCAYRYVFDITKNKIKITKDCFSKELLDFEIERVRRSKQFKKFKVEAQDAIEKNKYQSYSYEDTKRKVEELYFLFYDNLDIISSQLNIHNYPNLHGQFPLDNKLSEWNDEKVLRLVNNMKLLKS